MKLRTLIALAALASRRSRPRPASHPPLDHHQHRELRPAGPPAARIRSEDQHQGPRHLGRHRQGAGTGQERRRRRHPGACARRRRQVRRRRPRRRPARRDVQRLHRRRARQSDPAGVKGSKDVIAAFTKIAASGAKFISRGDNSGTDVMEKVVLEAGRRAAGQRQRYISAGLGMGEVLTMAAELQAYTLTDRATYGAYKAKTGLAVLVEGDTQDVQPLRHHRGQPGAPSGRQLQGREAADRLDHVAGRPAQIAAFRPAGQQLFFPSANRCRTDTSRCRSCTARKELSNRLAKKTSHPSHKRGMLAQGIRTSRI